MHATGNDMLACGFASRAQGLSRCDACGTCADRMGDFDLPQLLEWMNAGAVAGTSNELRSLA